MWVGGYNTGCITKSQETITDLSKRAITVVRIKTYPFWSLQEMTNLYIFLID